MVTEHRIDSSELKVVRSNPTVRLKPMGGAIASEQFSGPSFEKPTNVTFSTRTELLPIK